MGRNCRYGRHCLTAYINNIDTENCWFLRKQDFNYIHNYDISYMQLHFMKSLFFHPFILISFFIPSSGLLKYIIGYSDFLIFILVCALDCIRISYSLPPKKSNQLTRLTHNPKYPSINGSLTARIIQFYSPKCTYQQC